jgi:Na+-translocating ferredoxin:NAD+ oxidoreductase RnfC subunit
VARIPGETVDAYKEGRAGSVEEYDHRVAENRTRRNVQREIRERDAEEKRRAAEAKRMRAEEERIKREEVSQAHRRKLAEHQRRELNIRQKETKNTEMRSSQDRRLARANRPLPPPRGGGYGNAPPSRGSDIEARMNRASDALSGGRAADIHRRMGDIDDMLR